MRTLHPYAGLLECPLVKTFITMGVILRGTMPVVMVIIDKSVRSCWSEFFPSTLDMSLHHWLLD